MTSWLVLAGVLNPKGFVVMARSKGGNPFTVFRLLFLLCAFLLNGARTSFTELTNKALQGAYTEVYKELNDNPLEDDEHDEDDLPELPVQPVVQSVVQREVVEPEPVYQPQVYQPQVYQQPTEHVHCVKPRLFSRLFNREFRPFKRLFNRD